MAKIPSYPAASDLTGSEELIGVQSAASVKVTSNQMQEFIYNPMYKTSAFTASSGDLIYVASDVSAITITLPITPTTGDYVSVWDTGDNASVSAITIARNGETINDLAEDAFINMNGGRMDFMYNGTTWKYSYVVQTIQPSTTITRTIRKEFRAEDFYPYTCTEVTSSSGPTSVKALAFGDTGYTVGLSLSTLPKEWVQGARMRTRLIWNPTSTSTGNAYFLTQFSLVPNGDTWDGDPDVTQTCTNNENAGGVADDTQITSWSSWGDALTGSVDDALYIKLMRAGASDTLTGNAEVRMLEIEFEYEESITAAVNNNPNILYNEQIGTTYTIQTSDAGKEIVFTNAGAVAVTLPDGLPQNFQCILSQEGAGTVTVTPSGSDTLNGAGTGIATSGQYTALHLGKRTSSNWLVKGA